MNSSTTLASGSDIDTQKIRGLYARMHTLRNAPTEHESAAEIHQVRSHSWVGESAVDDNIDTSMFGETELRDINDGIDEFLRQLKKQESEIIRRKLIKPPLKKFILLPLFILICSIVSLFIIGNVYLDTNETRQGGWIANLFAVRSTQQDPSQASNAAQELIAGIRDENEARIVELFVDLINVESAEVEPSAQADDAAEARQQDIAVRKEEINQEIAEAQSDSNFEEFQAQTQQLEELQGEFQALSNQHSRANLQSDQYASIISQINNALDRNNFQQVNVLINQLQGFLDNPVIRTNPLLNDLLITGPVFVKSVQLYTTTAQELENEAETRSIAIENAIRTVQNENEAAQSAIEELSAQSTELDEQIAQNRELSVANQELGEELGRLQNRIGALDADNTRLETIANDLAQDNQQLETQTIELIFQIDELTNEIRRIRNER